MLQGSCWRAVLVVVLLCGTVSLAQAVDLSGVPQIPWRPHVYECLMAESPVIVDGDLSEPAWANMAWTESFVDIRGGDHEKPRFKTQVKMTWDNDYFYVAAQLEEPNIWAKLTDRDAIIYYDNDFEVFIDPNGDTHEYYELEINAFGTEWDLFLGKPYRDGGPALHEWDIAGLKSAVKIQGTLNDPSDKDEGWTVEIAFPWSVLGSAARRDCPPKPGDTWRINFSRVHWDTEVVGGEIVKQTGEDGKSLPEHNWVWSPQGLINMHYPEMWGFVRFWEQPFMGRLAHPATIPEEEKKWRLRQAYYAFKYGGKIPEGVESLTTPKGFEAWIATESEVWFIDETGRVTRVSE